MTSIKEIYNRNADNYDDLHFNPNSAAEYVEKKRLDLILPCIDKGKDLKILDVACGSGTYLLKYKEAGAITFGADITPNFTKVCRNIGLYNIVCADYHFLPFKSNYFDMVLNINAIHYSKNPLKVLREINRITVEDGILVFTYFNALNFRFFNLIRGRYIKESPVVMESRFFPFQMLKMFKDSGFEVINCFGINILPYRVNSKPRSKKILNICSEIEDNIKNTPLMHLFGEVFVILKKTNRRY